MKKHLQFLLLLLGESFIALWSCKKDHGAQPKATTFTLEFNTQKAFHFTGFFTASGGVTTSGNCTMDVTPVGTDSIHCTQTLEVPSEGTITILSQCSLPNNTGAWHVSSGTGIYANLQGEGTLVMSTGATGPIEALHGTTWRQ